MKRATCPKSYDCWAKAADFAVPAEDPGGMVTMGFQNATTGRFTPGAGSVLSPIDAGRTWTTFSFRQSGGSVRRLSSAV
jgi:hypothetical protein